MAGVPGTHPADRVLAVNFLGPRHLTEAMLDELRPGRAIVNVASTAGSFWQQNYDTVKALVDTPGFTEGAAWFAAQPAGYPPYNLSKEAVIVYTMFLSGRAWGLGLRANSVSPGPVETPILPEFEASMGKETLDSVRRTVGRHGRPEDVAPIVAFLADSASSWLNGANVIADGGFLAAMTVGATTT